MTMPKGFKVENGYATSAELGGKSYHQIAEIMTDRGFKMNHSTARNVFVSSLQKIASEVTDLYDLQLSRKELKNIAIDPRFQEVVRHFMLERRRDDSSSF